MDWLIKGCVVLISAFVFFKIMVLYAASPKNLSDLSVKLQLLFTGFIANVADTLGLGSFASVLLLLQLLA